MNNYKLLKRLKKGKYNVSLVSYCDCDIVWKIENNALVEQTEPGDECFKEVVLTVDRELIAKYTGGESILVLRHGLYYSHIPGEAVDNMMWEYPIFNSKDKIRHSIKSKEALIWFLHDQLNEGSRLFIDSLDGKSNEYRCILIRPDSKVVIEKNWRSVSAEEWAVSLTYVPEYSIKSFITYSII
jgi:hypothetical protein